MNHLNVELSRRVSVIHLAAVIGITLLQGCGGGGGGSGTSANTNNVSTVETEAGLNTNPAPANSGTTDSSYTTVDLPMAVIPVETDTSTSTPPASIESSNTVHEQPASVTTPTPTDSLLAWARPLGAKVANFNAAPDHVPAWTYIAGGEFPGSNGSLQSITSDNDATPAARLNYDLGCNTSYTTLKTGAACGRYVALSYKLPEPVALAATDKAVLAFDMRNPQSVVNPMVRVVDSTGQVLQFRPAGRNLESVSGDNWRRIYLPINRSTSYYGGANDGVLHAPIKHVILGAGDFAQQQPAGHIDFDNIDIIKNPTYSFELKPQAQLGTGAFYPTYIGRLGINTYTSNELAHDKAKAVGINVVRRDLTWNKVEKNGAYDFTDFNIVLEKLRARGMSVLWILDYGHVDHGGKTPESDANKTAFANFARAAALNFKGKNVIGFEIWNEPNGVRFWPNQDPQDYSKLFNKAAQAIREVDSNVKIVTGGLSGVDINYSLQMASYVNPALVDAVAIHPYTKLGPESFANGYQPFKNAIADRGLNKSVWVTEWGYSSYGDFDAVLYGNGFAPAARNRQAVLILRKILTQMAMNIPFMSIYGLTDYGSNATDREANFGIMAQDASDKPALVALRSLYAAQNGRIFKGYLTDVPPGLHAVRWDGSSDKVFAIWGGEDTQGPVEVRIPANATAIKRWDGTNVSTTTLGAYRVLSLKETDGPIIVTLSN